MILLLFWLFVKHFVVDFLLQTPYQYQNKGKFGHPGGLLHASLHGIGSGWILLILAPTILWVAVVDAVVHYFIDYGKVKINTHYKWGPLISAKFWYLLGFDQFLHQMTYLWMVSYV